MKFTDEDVIKAVDICISIDHDCGDCPFSMCGDCEKVVRECLQDIYKRQKAEVERYKHSIKLLEKDVADAKSDTVKEFAKFVIDKSVKGVIYVSDVVDYVPEFLGR